MLSGGSQCPCHRTLALWHPGTLGTPGTLAPLAPWHSWHHGTLAPLAPLALVWCYQSEYVEPSSAVPSAPLFTL